MQYLFITDKLEATPNCKTFKMYSLREVSIKVTLKGMENDIDVRYLCYIKLNKINTMTIFFIVKYVDMI